MRKYLLILIPICIYLLFFIPCKGYSADLSVGASTWAVMGIQDTGHTTNISYPTLLIGPIFSLKFDEDMNLTFVFLYGKFYYIDPLSGAGSSHVSTRIDLDLAFNYRLNDYFKLFAGLKYLSFDVMKEKHGEFQNNGKHASMGPGLGISSTFPIEKNLFLLANLSGFYLGNAGEDKIEKKDSLGNTTDSSKASYREYGINSTISIAYYIPDASTAINLGGRLQYFNTKYKNDEFPIKMKIYMFGATLSATYSFSI